MNVTERDKAWIEHFEKSHRENRDRANKTLRENYEKWNTWRPNAHPDGMTAELFTE
jgi:hypothetical protein